MHMNEMLDVTLASRRDTPCRARTAVGGLEGSLEGMRQPVRLLVSELVTNAVRHSGAGPSGTVQVTLDCSDDGVRVEVTDDGQGFVPSSASRTEPPMDGFGLLLVDELADRWGVHVERGARVWFEIDR
jgi:anti-sigma regulatory factor (Ser/Thr protein kinase)